MHTRCVLNDGFASTRVGRLLGCGTQLIFIRSHISMRGRCVIVSDMQLACVPSELYVTGLADLATVVHSHTTQYIHCCWLHTVQYTETCCGAVNDWGALCAHVLAMGC